MSLMARRRAPTAFAAVGGEADCEVRDLGVWAKAAVAMSPQAIVRISILFIGILRSELDSLKPSEMKPSHSLPAQSLRRSMLPGGWTSLAAA